VSKILTLDDVLQALEEDAYLGFCLACGAQHDGIEPDARRYVCEECGAHRVYGAEEILLVMGEDAPMSSSPHPAQAAYDMSTTGMYKGFTHQALSDAFDRLSDPADWKAPIDAWVPGELVLVAVCAIEFYTSTSPIITLDTDTMQYRLTAPGYRQGPAGDH
jgi:predicted heme/steroid binding protein